MKQIITVMVFVAALVCATRAETTVTSFSGRVVDERQRPISNAVVRIYRGHRGLKHFEIDVDTNITTKVNGTFAGALPGHPDHFYRAIRAEGFKSQHTDKWKTNETVVLYHERTFTQHELEPLRAGPTNALSGPLAHLLAYRNAVIMFPPSFLKENSKRLRPALIELLSHDDSYVVFSARDCLRTTGHPKDLDLSAIDMRECEEALASGKARTAAILRDPEYANNPDYPVVGITIDEFQALIKELKVALPASRHISEIRLSKGKVASVMTRMTHPSDSGRPAVSLTRSTLLQLKHEGWVEIKEARSDDDNVRQKSLTVGDLWELARSLRPIMTVKFDDGSSMPVALPAQWGGIMLLQVEDNGAATIQTGIRTGNLGGTGTTYHFERNNGAWILRGTGYWES